MPSEEEVDDAAYQLGLNLDRLLVGVGLVPADLMLKHKRLGALGDIGHPTQDTLALDPPPACTT